jgi:hypothetical protein
MADSTVALLNYPRPCEWVSNVASKGVEQPMTLTESEATEGDIVPAQSPEAPMSWQDYAQLIRAG